jgi:uncharacterized protein
VRDLDTLFDTLEAAQSQKSLPPVDRWHPERVGRIDIRIARDGTWYHEGAPIRREALVKLFSTVLRRDDDGYCLVTPAERLFIDVEDAPFLAVDMTVKGEGSQAQLLFTTNVADHVVADADHPIRVEDQDGEPRPYVHVRRRPRRADQPGGVLPVGRAVGAGAGGARCLQPRGAVRVGSAGIWC